MIHRFDALVNRLFEISIKKISTLGWIFFICFDPVDAAMHGICRKRQCDANIGGKCAYSTDITRTAMMIMGSTKVA